MLHYIITLLLVTTQGEELVKLQKSNSEQLLELKNELASLQMSNENIIDKLRKKEQQLSEVRHCSNKHCLACIV